MKNIIAKKFYREIFNNFKSREDFISKESKLISLIHSKDFNYLFSPVLSFKKIYEFIKEVINDKKIINFFIYCYNHKNKDLFLRTIAMYIKNNNSNITVISANQMTKKQLDNIKKKIETKQKVKINSCINKVNKDLIAGFQVVYENKILDYSFKNKIKV